MTLQPSLPGEGKFYLLRNLPFPNLDEYTMLSEHKKGNLRADWGREGLWILSRNRQAGATREARHMRTELRSLFEIIRGINRAVMDVYFVVQMGSCAGAR